MDKWIVSQRTWQMVFSQIVWGYGTYVLSFEEDNIYYVQYAVYSFASCSVAMRTFFQCLKNYSF